VQLGGDTFSEVLVFQSKDALDRLKGGKMAFAANASAVLVKAGAAAAAGFRKGVAAFVYSTGGMLLELAIGGQKFKFKPLGEQEDESEKSKARGAQQEEEDQDGGDEQESGAGVLGKVVGLAKEHPLASTLIGVGLVTAAAAFATRSMWMPSGGSSAGDEDQSDEDAGDQDEEDEQEEPDSRGHRNGNARARHDEGDEDEQDEEEDDDDDTGARDEQSDEADDEEGEEDDEEEEAPARKSRSGRRWF